MWIQGALGGSGAEYTPTFRHVFTRWLQTSCPDRPHSPDDGLTPTLFFLLLPSFLFWPPLGLWPQSPMPLDLSSEPQTPSSIYLPDRPPGKSRKPLRFNTATLNSLVSTILPRSLAPALQLLLAALHLQPASLSSQTTRHLLHPRHLPHLHAQLVTVACQFFLLKIFQTCFSSPSLRSFDPVLGLVQKSPNLSPPPVSSPSDPLSALQPEGNFKHANLTPAPNIL